MALPVIAGMAALGLMKGMMDKQAEAKDRKQAAEMARWSPWTGMKPNEIKKGDVLGSTMQGGMAGAMMAPSLAGSFGGEAAAEPAEMASLDEVAAEPAAAPMTGAPAYGQTPATAAMQNGTFPQHYQQQYTSPWTQMK